MEKVISTLEAFEAEAAAFAKSLMPRESGATLVTLSGELGAGKTVFTKAVAHTLGVGDVVTSPTFVLEKVYPLSGQSFKQLIHIDAYRLEKGADLGPLEIDGLMKDAQNLIFLEWPERVAESLPVPTKKIAIVVNADGTRTISYE
ncbi:MAG: hypothetical protein RLZZ26_172 [Candidatus Parcubacteria bacterium]|jgi:tRNA threonylcarbamoyladenosine biosynthesis protein TsaE